MRIIRNLLAFLLACFAAAFAWAVFSHAAPLSFDQMLDRTPDILAAAWKDVTRASLVKESASLHPAYSLLGRLPALPLAFAVLSALPALLVTQYADNHGIRTWSYYAIAALIVGVGAYWLADAFAVTPERTEANIFGTIAFAAASLVYATVYWLFSGRFAGRTPGVIEATPVKPEDRKFGEPSPDKA
ncbi:MAG: hypothetical protein F9K44_15620 [Hyphomicrobiaceae bacterium]|nr:MAG: hypothetical protein F9K44_15620 [Hyphomicrobiaceae bacterium]